MAPQTHVTLQHPGEAYDPKQHITAKELRAVGAMIPSSIPDCAWVPRGFSPPFKVTVEEDDSKRPNVLRGTIWLGLRGGGEFQWRETDITIEGDVNPADLVPGGPDGLP